MLLEFPGRHIRPSTKSVSVAGARAAKAASIPAFSPASRATDVASNGAHHSAGILFRCAHLRPAALAAPTSAAMAPGEGQSEITSRNVENSIMESSIGQIVLNCKAILSHDWELPGGENDRMADRMSETEEKLAFIGRVRAARVARFETQKPMLTILGIDQGTYKQYETRTPLPHRFIPKFCAATGVEIDWLLTGDGKGPVAVLHYPEAKQAKPQRRRQRSRKVA